MKIKFTYEQYAADVSSGNQIACDYVKLAVKRWDDDLKNGHQRGLWFDEQAAQRAIKFMSLLTQFEGKFHGKPLMLEPWQQFIVANLFGWKWEDGSRRFTESYIELARKNGKSTLGGGIADYMFAADGEYGAEIYSAATKRDQAKKVFEAGKYLLKNSTSKKLREMVTFQNYNLHIEEKYSKFEPLSSDHKRLDGLNPHCVIIDEYHAHPDNGVYSVMKSGMGSRRQPLLFLITTAGFNRQSPCYIQRNLVDNVLRGVAEQDSLFGMIYTLDEDDDWKDESKWIKANPNLGVSVNTKWLAAEISRADADNSQIVPVMTKNLNVWTDAAETWIKDADWMACDIGALPDLTGKECYGGLDLASTRDISALVLQFPDVYGKKQILPIFWMPEMNYKERVERDKVNYDVWIREGFIRITPGNVTDYEFIKADILKLAKKYSIRKIAYDRWNASQLVIDLMEKGIKMEGFGQGFGSMSAPTKELNKLVLKKEINHAGNPVLRWMCSNVSIKRDPADNIKIDKANSQEKVDGMVSLVMALGMELNDDGKKTYNQHGLRKLVKK
jgi:phage terminase large subunit-like protein